MIQLCLGAIYAWSVFTPALAAPLPENFNDVNTVDGIDLIVGGDDLVVNEESTILLTFQHNDATVSMDNVTVTMELRDENGDDIKSLDPIEATPSGDSYTFNVEVEEAGNWHYVVSAEYNGTELTQNFDVLEKVGTGKFGFSKTQTQAVFSAGLATFAFVMIIAGRLQAKFGPRTIALLGGAVLGLGYIAGSFVGTSFIGLLLTIGILGGAGIGLAYVVPIAVGVKWFPDKKGLISGLAVAGFGFGALLWIKLATGFVFGPVSLSGDWGGLFETFSVSQVFLIYGIAFLVAVVLGGLVMVNPPEDWKPEGWEPPKATEKDASGSVNFTAKEMLKTPQFYGLWTMFVFGALAGLMVIGIIALFGISALKDSGYTTAEAATIAGTAMALFYSLSNGIGRIAWGAISDKIGRKTSLIVMFGLQGLMMIAFYFVGGNEYLLYIGALVVGFNFGGNFALFPAATADFFGDKTVGLNYGWVFSAYGIGGIIGPLLGGYMGDHEIWLWAFIPAGIACLVAMVIGIFLKPPVKEEGDTSETDAGEVVEE